MTTLTVTTKGQITLKKDVLRHLGIEPGQKVRADLTHDGEVRLRPMPKNGGLDAFIGSLYDPDGPKLTIEEINEAIADGWAGKR